MKAIAAALATLVAPCLRGCHASSLRAKPDDEERKLTSSHDSTSSPLNYDNYVKQIFDHHHQWLIMDYGLVKYNYVLATVPGGPTTAQLLAMFSDKFVEHKGKVYTVADHLFTNFQGTNARIEKLGLYEVISLGPGDGVGFVNNPSGNPIMETVRFELLYEDANLGQIVASSAMFDPIEIIGVDKVTNEIYGYFPDSSGVWTKEKTVWGDAKVGSLISEQWEGGLVMGLSTNDRMMHLWGDSSNFNYHKQDNIECATRPANIGDWTGFWSGSRGVYCPGVANNQLKKYKWNANPETEELIWEPAARIGRLSSSSNIFGVSTIGELLTLWDSGTAVHSLALQFSELKEVRSVGGLDNGWERGVFVSNQDDHVFNVYWDGTAESWDIVLLPIYLRTEPCYRYGDLGRVVVYFGNHNDETYVLYGSNPNYENCYTQYDLYRLEWKGHNDRYDAVHVQDGRFVCGYDVPCH